VADQGAGGRERAWRRAGFASLSALVAVYGALALGSASQTSVTVDELGHLPSGVYFLLTGDPRYASLNPPLVNALSALPVLRLDLDPALEAPAPSDDPFSFWENGYHFQERHRADYLRIFAAARRVPIALVALLGVLLFVWARRLAPHAPDLAGLLAAGFFCLSPNVIAHSGLVATDTGAAVFVALALFALRALLLSPGPATALGCGVALGLAQLAKLYALLLYPAAVLIALAWHRWSPAPRPPAARVAGWLVAALAASLIVLNAGYGFREIGTSLSGLALQSQGLREWQSGWVGGVPLPLPGAWLRGLDGQLVEVSSQIPSFLMGETFTGGRPDFYVVLLALKTPIALMVAFGVALVVSLPRPRLPAREAVLLLCFPVLLFVSMSASGGRQLGLRALLPAAPLVWVFAAASIARCAPARWPGWIAVAALAGTLATSLLAYPDYLSYFNAFAGGSKQGWRHAGESSVDIGQDLVKLARFLAEQPAGSVQLFYFGSVDPALYGIDYRVPVDRPEPGLLAVSVSLYHMAYPMYDHGALRRVGPVDAASLGEPIAQLGGSIHVYRIGR
jgi:hypothetical protein